MRALPVLFLGLLFGVYGADQVSFSRGAASGAGATAIGGTTALVQLNDQTVNNSAAPVNATNLTMAVQANAAYLWNCNLILTAASTTPDFFFQWSVPSGTTFVWGWDLGINGTSVAFGGWAANQTTAATPSALTTAAGTTSIASMNGTLGAHMKGVMQVSSTAGTAVLQWSQNTQTLENSVLAKNSNCLVTRLQ